MNLLTPRALAEEISRYPADLQAQVIADVKLRVAEIMSETLRESKEQHEYYLKANKQIEMV